MNQQELEALQEDLETLALNLAEMMEEMVERLQALGDKKE